MRRTRWGDRQGALCTPFTLVILNTHGNRKPRGVAHCGLVIYIKKYLKAKEEEEKWKLKYFTMQKYNLQKIL